MYIKLDPDVHSGMDVVDAPLVAASAETLEGFGCLVDVYEDKEIEIVRWPAQGWRAVDDDTGDEGGTTEGTFHFTWRGDVLYGHNDAVDDRYLLGWSRHPAEASEEISTAPRSELYLRHVNYHPDGGQLFFPRAETPFVTPLALPGDDVTPQDFVCFYCDGTQGLYIHPGVWHEGIFPLGDDTSFFDKQGKVHARVSCNFDEEFGVYLRAPLRAP